MAWNADGTFSRSYDWTDEAAAGNNISSTKFDTENETFRLGIQNCINKDGKNAPSTDLPMGGNKHTGVADGTARAHYASVGQVQDGGATYLGTTGGTANVQTATLTPAITAYAAGQMFSFIAGTTNTAATTLNVNSVGAKSIYNGNAACIGGEIISGQMYVVLYDGTRFHIIGSRDSNLVYSVVAVKSANQVTNSSSAAAVQWDGSDLWDYGSMHNPSANNTRLTAPVDGIYHVSVSVTFDTNGTGYRRVAIYKAATSSVHGEAIIPADSSSPTVVSCSADVNLNAGQYVDIYAEQSSGGLLNIVGGNIGPGMHLVRRL